MKRYKDCLLICNEGQKPIELLDIVETVSTQQKYQTERYKTMADRDTLAVDLREEGYPHSRLIVSANADDNAVSIVNIVPMRDSGISQLGHTKYNNLLDVFKTKVFVTIHESQKNEIQENSEDYVIEDIIPNSFSKLSTWLSCYPLSGHPLDERRWFAFVVSLHTNHETLSIDDFIEYIRENYNWNENVIHKFALKLESQLALLEYYDECRR